MTGIKDYLCYNQDMDKNRIFKTISTVCSCVILLAAVVLCIWGWQAGVFTSLEKLQAAIASAGIWGSLLFILLQIAQIMIPFIPGGLTNMAGVVLFGPWPGFWLNYFSVAVGSLLAFQLGRIFGKPLLYKMFAPEKIEKYENWCSTKNRFEKLLAIAILLPGFPDDMLCWLAGTTKMKFWHFLLIIIIGKPLILSFYSLGLHWLWPIPPKKPIA